MFSESGRLEGRDKEVGFLMRVLLLYLYCIFCCGFSSTVGASFRIQFAFIHLIAFLDGSFIRPELYFLQ